MDSIIRALARVLVCVNDFELKCITLDSGGLIRPSASRCWRQPVLGIICAPDTRTVAILTTDTRYLALYRIRGVAGRHE